MRLYLKLIYDFGGGDVLSMKEFVNFEISGIAKTVLCVKFLNVKFSDTVTMVLQHKQVHIGVQTSS